MQYRNCTRSFFAVVRRAAYIDEIINPRPDGHFARKLHNREVNDLRIIACNRASSRLFFFFSPTENGRPLADNGKQRTLRGIRGDLRAKYWFMKRRRVYIYSRGISSTAEKDSGDCDCSIRWINLAIIVATVYISQWEPLRAPRENIIGDSCGGTGAAELTLFFLL